MRRIDRNRKELHDQHHDWTSGRLQRRRRQRHEAVRPLPADDQTERPDSESAVMVRKSSGYGEVIRPLHWLPMSAHGWSV